MLKKTKSIFFIFSDRNNKDIDKDTFKSNVIMFVLAGPQSQFTEDEFKYIKVSFHLINENILDMISVVCGYIFYILSSLT